MDHEVERDSGVGHRDEQDQADYADPRTVGEINWVELGTTTLRLLAAFWLFSTALGGADPRLGKIGARQRIIRFAAGACAMIPLTQIWAPAIVVAFLIRFFSSQTGKSMLQNEV